MKNILLLFSLILLVLAGSALVGVIIPSQLSADRMVLSQGDYRLLAHDDTVVAYDMWPDGPGFILLGTAYQLDIPALEEFVDIAVEAHISCDHFYDVSQNISALFSLDGENWKVKGYNVKKRNLIGNDYSQNDSYYLFTDREEITFRIPIPPEFRHKPFKIRIDYVWKGSRHEGWPRYEAFLRIFKAVICGK